MNNKQEQKPAKRNQAMDLFRYYKKPIIIAATIASIAFAYDAFSVCGSPCPSTKKWNSLLGYCQAC